MDRVKFSSEKYTTGDIRSEEYLAKTAAHWGYKNTQDFLDGPLYIKDDWNDAPYGKPYDEKGGINFSSFSKLTIPASGYNPEQLKAFLQSKDGEESKGDSSYIEQSELDTSFESYEDDLSFENNEERILRDRDSRKTKPPRKIIPISTDRPKEKVDLSDGMFLYGVSSGLSVDEMASIQKKKDKVYLAHSSFKEDVNYPYNRMRIRFGEGSTTDPSPYGYEDGMRTYTNAQPGSIHFMAVYEDVFKKWNGGNLPDMLYDDHISIDSYVPLMSLHTAVMVLHFVRMLSDYTNISAMGTRYDIVTKNILPLVVGFETFSGAFSKENQKVKRRTIAENSRNIIFVPVILGQEASLVDISDYDTVDNLLKLYKITKRKNGYVEDTIDRGLPDLEDLNTFSITHGLESMKTDIESIRNSKEFPKYTYACSRLMKIMSMAKKTGVDAFVGHKALGHHGVFGSFGYTGSIMLIHREAMRESVTIHAFLRHIDFGYKPSVHRHARLAAKLQPYLGKYAKIHTKEKKANHYVFLFGLPERGDTGNEFYLSSDAMDVKGLGALMQKGSSIGTTTHHDLSLTTTPGVSRYVFPTETREDKEVEKYTFFESKLETKKKVREKMYRRFRGSTYSVWPIGDILKTRYEWDGSLYDGYHDTGEKAELLRPSDSERRNELLEKIIKDKETRLTKPIDPVYSFADLSLPGIYLYPSVYSRQSLAKMRKDYTVTKETLANAEDFKKHYGLLRLSAYGTSSITNEYNTMSWVYGLETPMASMFRSAIRQILYRSYWDMGELDGKYITAHAFPSILENMDFFGQPNAAFRPPSSKQPWIIKGKGEEGVQEINIEEAEQMADETSIPASFGYVVASWLHPEGGKVEGPSLFANERTDQPLSEEEALRRILLACEIIQYQSDPSMVSGISPSPATGISFPGVPADYIMGAVFSDSRLISALSGSKKIQPFGVGDDYKNLGVRLRSNVLRYTSILSTLAATADVMKTWIRFARRLDAIYPMKLRKQKKKEGRGTLVQRQIDRTYGFGMWTAAKYILRLSSENRLQDTESVDSVEEDKYWSIPNFAHITTLTEDEGQNNWMPATVVAEEVFDEYLQEFQRLKRMHWEMDGEIGVFLENTHLNNAEWYMYTPIRMWHTQARAQLSRLIDLMMIYFSYRRDALLGTTFSMYGLHNAQTALVSETGDPLKFFTYKDGGVTHTTPEKVSEYYKTLNKDYQRDQFDEDQRTDEEVRLVSQHLDVVSGWASTRAIKREWIEKRAGAIDVDTLLFPPREEGIRARLGPSALPKWDTITFAGAKFNSTFTLEDFNPRKHLNLALHDILSEEDDSILLSKLREVLNDRSIHAPRLKIRHSGDRLKGNGLFCDDPRGIPPGTFIMPFDGWVVGKKRYNQIVRNNPRLKLSYDLKDAMVLGNDKDNNEDILLISSSGTTVHNEKYLVVCSEDSEEMESFRNAKHLVESTFNISFDSKNTIFLSGRGTRGSFPRNVPKDLVFDFIWFAGCNLALDLGFGPANLRETKEKFRNMTHSDTKVIFTDTFDHWNPYLEIYRKEVPQQFLSLSEKRGKTETLVNVESLIYIPMEGHGGGEERYANAMENLKNVLEPLGEGKYYYQIKDPRGMRPESSLSTGRYLVVCSSDTEEQISFRQGRDMVQSMFSITFTNENTDFLGGAEKKFPRDVPKDTFYDLIWFAGCNMAVWLGFTEENSEKTLDTFRKSAHKHTKVVFTESTRKIDSYKRKYPGEFPKRFPNRFDKGTQFSPVDLLITTDGKSSPHSDVRKAMELLKRELIPPKDGDVFYTLKYPMSPIPDSLERAHLSRFINTACSKEMANCAIVHWVIEGQETLWIVNPFTRSIEQGEELLMVYDTSDPLDYFRDFGLYARTPGFVYPPDEIRDDKGKVVRRIENYDLRNTRMNPSFHLQHSKITGRDAARVNELEIKSRQNPDGKIEARSFPMRQPLWSILDDWSNNVKTRRVLDYTPILGAYKNPVTGSWHTPLRYIGSRVEDTHVIPYYKRTMSAIERTTSTNYYGCPTLRPPSSFVRKYVAPVFKKMAQRYGPNAVMDLKLDISERSYDNMPVLYHNNKTKPVDELDDELSVLNKARDIHMGVQEDTEINTQITHILFMARRRKLYKEMDRLLEKKDDLSDEEFKRQYNENMKVLQDLSLESLKGRGERKNYQPKEWLSFTTKAAKSLKEMTEQDAGFSIYDTSSMVSFNYTNMQCSADDTKMLESGEVRSSAGEKYHSWAESQNRGGVVDASSPAVKPMYSGDPERGIGLYALRDIAPGEPVVHFTGRVVRASTMTRKVQEYRKRYNRALSDYKYRVERGEDEYEAALYVAEQYQIDHPDPHFYSSVYMDLSERGGPVLLVDNTMVGSVARFSNNSRYYANVTMETILVEVPHKTKKKTKNLYLESISHLPIPTLVNTFSRTIKRGEEIVWDYVGHTIYKEEFGYETPPPMMNFNTYSVDDTKHPPTIVVPPYLASPDYAAPQTPRPVPETPSPAPAPTPAPTTAPTPVPESPSPTIPAEPVPVVEREPGWVAEWDALEAQAEEASLKGRTVESWVTRYFDDIRIGKQTIEGGGDCLFRAVKSGLESIAKSIAKANRTVPTSVPEVAKLREIWSEYITEEDYNTAIEFAGMMWDIIKDSVKGRPTDLDEEVENILTTVIVSSIDNDHATSIYIGGKVFNVEKGKAFDAVPKIERILGKDKVIRVPFKDGRTRWIVWDVETLEDYKRKIKNSCAALGSKMAIESIENHAFFFGTDKAYIRLVVLDKKNYQENKRAKGFETYKDAQGKFGRDIKEVVGCTTDTRQYANPDYYIFFIFDSSSVHYDLMTFKPTPKGERMSAFTFAEIPFVLKKIIAERCAQNRNGDLTRAFGTIPDFIDFIAKLKKLPMWMERRRERREEEGPSTPLAAEEPEKLSVKEFIKQFIALRKSMVRNVTNLKRQIEKSPDFKVKPEDATMLVGRIDEAMRVLDNTKMQEMEYIEKAEKNIADFEEKLNNPSDPIGPTSPKDLNELIEENEERLKILEEGEGEEKLSEDELNNEIAEYKELIDAWREKYNKTEGETLDEKQANYEEERAKLNDKIKSLKNSIEEKTQTISTKLQTEDLDHKKLKEGLQNLNDERISVRRAFFDLLGEYAKKKVDKMENDLDIKPIRSPIPRPWKTLRNLKDGLFKIGPRITGEGGPGLVEFSGDMNLVPSVDLAEKRERSEGAVLKYGRGLLSMHWSQIHRIMGPNTFGGSRRDYQHRADVPKSMELLRTFLKVKGELNPSDMTPLSRVGDILHGPVESAEMLNLHSLLKVRTGAENFSDAVTKAWTSSSSLFHTLPMRFFKNTEDRDQWLFDETGGNGGKGIRDLYFDEESIVASILFSLNHAIDDIQERIMVTVEYADIPTDEIVKLSLDGKTLDEKIPSQAMRNLFYVFICNWRQNAVIITDYNLPLEKQLEHISLLCDMLWITSLGFKDDKGNLRTFTRLRTSDEYMRYTGETLDPSEGETVYTHLLDNLMSGNELRRDVSIFNSVFDTGIRFQSEWDFIGERKEMIESWVSRNTIQLSNPVPTTTAFENVLSTVNDSIRMHMEADETESKTVISQVGTYFEQHETYMAADGRTFNVVVKMDSIFRIAHDATVKMKVYNTKEVTTETGEKVRVAAREEPIKKFPIPMLKLEAEAGRPKLSYASRKHIDHLLKAVEKARSETQQYVDEERGSGEEEVEGISSPEPKNFTSFRVYVESFMDWMILKNIAYLRKLAKLLVTKYKDKVIYKHAQRAIEILLDPKEITDYAAFQRWKHHRGPYSVLSDDDPTIRPEIVQEEDEVTFGKGSSAYFMLLRMTMALYIGKSLTELVNEFLITNVPDGKDNVKGDAWWSDSDQATRFWQTTRFYRESLWRTLLDKEKI